MPDGSTSNSRSASRSGARRQSSSSSRPSSPPPRCADPYPYRVRESKRTEDPFLDATAQQDDGRVLPEHHVPTWGATIARTASGAFRRSGELVRRSSKASSRRERAAAGAEGNGDANAAVDGVGEGNGAAANGSRPASPGRRGSSSSSIPTANGGGTVASPLTFQNPWPSFRQPSIFDAISDLHWGLPSTYRAAMRKKPKADRKDGGAEEDWDEVGVRSLPEGFASDDGEGGTGRPSVTDGTGLQVTWLGHATVLLRLPPLKQGGPPFTVLFDPIFSERCSPSQRAGPLRFTKAPCEVKDLPPVDVVCISHNHYDHLDELSIRALLAHSAVHVCVPLGVRDWMIATGFAPERVSELDWWDDALFTVAADQAASAPAEGDAKSSRRVRITCTPAQHNSGRALGDAATALWASWVVQLLPASGGGSEGDAGAGGRASPGATVFFAGDTGLKFSKGSEKKRDHFPDCPAFAQIAEKFGAPDLMLLPISVGSSLSYLRSFDPFPRAYSPFPRIGASLTSAIHMSPLDAVECARIMTRDAPADKRKRAVFLAVHFGTFIAGEIQTRADLHALRAACEKHGIEFVRSKDGSIDSKQQAGRNGQGDASDSEHPNGRFVVAHQAEPLLIPLSGE